MTRIARLSLLALVIATVAVAGCKKKDDKKNNKKKPKNTKVQPKGKTKTPPPKTDKPVTGEALVAVVTKCWGAFDSENAKAYSDCYADNGTIELVDQVPMMPSDVTKAAKKDLMKMVGPYWAGFKLKGHLDLILVNGSNTATIVRNEATNDAAMGPMPASNKTTKTFGSQLSSFDAKGKIVKDMHFFDQNSMSGQMGMMPKGMPFRGAWEKSLWDAPIRVVAKNDDKEKKNLAAYKAWMVDAAAGDVKKVLAHYADDIVSRHMDSPKDMTGKKALGGMMTMMKAGFPDYKMKTNSVWAAGDWVVAHATVTAKNTGAIPGMIPKATNKEFSGSSLSFVRYEGGKIKEMVQFSNGFHMFAQLFPDKLKAMKEAMAKQMGGAGKAPAKGDATKKPEKKPPTKNPPAKPPEVKKRG